MRLTVRTLLAWMDGTVGAEDQAALGDKVLASGVAPKLVERIKLVVSHPAVSVPPPDGRGFAEDPNTAAEFLDNALPAERLEAFERVCVESDAHLADVAEAHRLLAEMLRDPAVIEPLDAGVRRSLLDRLAARTELSDGTKRGAARAGVPTKTAAPRPRRHGAPLASWLSAAAAVALLAVLAGVLVWSIGRPGRTGNKVIDVAAIAPATPSEPPSEPPSPAAAEAAPKPAVAAEAAMPPPHNGPAATESVPPATPLSVAANPEVEVAAAPVADARPAAASPMAAPREPAASEPTPPATADMRVPSGDALAIVAQPAAPPAGAAPPPAPAVPPPLAPANEQAVTGPRSGGPLLHRGEIDGKATWLPLRADAELGEREELVAPPWCRPVLTVAGVTLRLEPGTRAVLTRGADDTPVLEVVFGRAVISAIGADAAIGVVAGGLRGELSGVMDRGAGIDVRFERAPGSGASSVRHAALHAGLGDKVWRQDAAAPLAGLPAEVLLPARASIVWDERDPAAAMLAPPADERWITAPPPGGRIERSAVRALAATLEAAPAAPVAESLRPLLADRRLENRMLAAATAALLGDYEELVALLCAEPPLTLGEGQWTTLEEMTLPLAIARGDNSAAALQAAFRSAGPAGKGDLLMALARGFSDDELASGADRTLVEALDDGSLAVRRFAIRRLAEIVPSDAPRSVAYRADRPDQLRRDGITWWRTQLEQGRIRRGGEPVRPSRSDRAPQARDDE